MIIGEDPFNIERLWSKMFLQTHGMSGIVGAGAISAIEMALWDIKGKAFNMPVWQLLGGQMRERLRVYTHANTAEHARELVDQGYTGLKMGVLNTASAILRRYAMRWETMSILWSICTACRG